MYKLDYLRLNTPLPCFLLLADSMSAASGGMAESWDVAVAAAENMVVAAAGSRWDVAAASAGVPKIGWLEKLLFKNKGLKINFVLI